MSLPIPADDGVLAIVICWLAVWRLTAMICYDRGPWDGFSYLRRGLARAGLSRLVSCFHCTAVWVSVGVVASVFEWRPLILLLMISIAGAASMTERWLSGGAFSTTDQDVEE